MLSGEREPIPHDAYATLTAIAKIRASEVFRVMFHVKQFVPTPGA